MKIAAFLLLAVGVVLLNTSSHVDAQRVGSSIVDPCWNVYCRRGYNCVPRGGRGVCVRGPWLRPCLQPVRRGPCHAYVRRYFYNRFTGRCQQFIYGGCGGNQNNFYTWRQCHRRCVRRPWYPIQQPAMPFAEPAMYNADPDS